MSVCRIPVFPKKGEANGEGGIANIGKIYITISENGNIKEEVMDLATGDFYLDLRSQNCSSENGGGDTSQIEQILDDFVNENIDCSED